MQQTVHGLMNRVGGIGGELFRMDRFVTGKKKDRCVQENVEH
jgi:hypothetical protein